MLPPEERDETSDLDSENTNVEKKVDLNSLNEIRDLYSSVRDDSKRLNLQLEQLEDLLENTFGIEVTRKEKEGNKQKHIMRNISSRILGLQSSKRSSYKGTDGEEDMVPSDEEGVEYTNTITSLIELPSKQGLRILLN